MAVCSVQVFRKLDRDKNGMLEEHEITRFLGWLSAQKPEYNKFNNPALAHVCPLALQQKRPLLASRWSVAE